MLIPATIPFVIKSVTSLNLSGLITVIIDPPMANIKAKTNAKL